MSDPVLADSQFSVAGVYRPFEGFESVYQGQPVSIPIVIPGVLDVNAGKTGFAANLLAGIPIPMGAKMCLWIPTIFNSVMGQLSIQPYRYTIVWRLRNLTDFIDQNRRAAYHFPRQSPGEGGQFVVPAAANVTIYEQTPVTFPTNQAGPSPSSFSQETRGIQSAVLESLSFSSAVANPAFTPTGTTAAYQQGLAAGQEGGNSSVSFNMVQVDAMGDEFMLLIDREFDSEDPANTWNFQAGQRDNGFSRFFGTNDGTRSVIRDMGVYVFTGSNP